MAEETKSGIGDMTELLGKQNETTAAVDESKKAQLRAAVLTKSTLEKDLGKIYQAEKEQEAEVKRAAEETKKTKKATEDSGDKSNSWWSKIYDTEMLGLKSMLKMDKSFSEGLGEVKDAFSQDISFLSDMMSPLTAIPGVSTAMAGLQFVGGKILGLLWSENRQKAKQWIKQKAQWAWEKAMAMRAAIKDRASALLSRKSGGESKTMKKGKKNIMQWLGRFFKTFLAVLLAPLVFLGALAKGLWKEIKPLAKWLMRPFTWLGGKIKAGWMKVFGGKSFPKMASAITKVKSGFTAVGTWFAWVGNKMAPMFNWFKSFMANSKILGIAARLGSAVAKIFWPITVVWGAIEGIIGAFKGWKSVEGGSWADKIIGAMSGFSKGVVNFVIGGILDLLKDLVAWLLSLFGIISDDTKQAINDWSFKDLISGLFDFLGQLMIDLWTVVKGIVVGAWEAIKAMWPGGESPAEAFTRGFKETWANRGKIGGGDAGEMSAASIEDGAADADEAERQRNYKEMDKSGEGWGTQAQIINQNTNINQGNKTYNAGNKSPVDTAGAAAGKGIWG